MNPKSIVLVASVSIFKDDHVFIIKESKPTAVHQWNFPSGHIEYGENILSAALREVKEETGYEVKLTHTTGVYNFNSSMDNQVILFHFTAEISGGALRLEEEGIIDSQWIKLKELALLEDGELREVGVLRPIIRQLQKRAFYPIQVFNETLGIR
ncbi:hypothetical protein GCM10011391_12340 [Pullulanibacillus camelliae]|uniref:Nudix hydrolase domain-containing protein n=1 Tax=Pullulanibacillus camelliae TaxID=1707096 RepID=A0A8J2YBZ6_9BACL|nr:NUDIX domain-containing protein [Pullulanibacillus camelliae]GGE35154.1 hypothetical protein GCM10011391_12340 [Pullulanibacillus camelliae]